MEKVLQTKPVETDQQPGLPYRITEEEEDQMRNTRWVMYLGEVE